MLRTIMSFTLLTVGVAVTLTACGNGGSPTLAPSTSETIGLDVPVADLQLGGKWQVSTRVRGFLECDSEPTLIEVKRCDENSPSPGTNCGGFADCRDSTHTSGNCVLDDTIEIYRCLINCTECQRACDLGMEEVCLRCQEAGCDKSGGSSGSYRTGRGLERR